MNTDQSKKIIIGLSVAVLFLVISNVATLRKLDMTTQLPAPIPEMDIEEVEPIKEKATQPKVIAGKIVLVIDDFGYRNDAVSDGFLKLNVPITCAIIPGHRQTSHFAKKAIAAGQEVIIHMPMESALNTPGEDEYKLRSGMTSEEIEWRMNEVLREMPEAVGMNNHQGSKATTDGKVMTVVGSVLKKHEKYFLDSRTVSNTVGEKTMRHLGVPTARRHVFLDNDSSLDQIKAQLNILVRLAKKRGMAIGIGHAKPNTLQVLKEKIPILIDEGFQFEFASKIVN